MEIRFWDHSYADHIEAAEKLAASVIALTESDRRQQYLTTVQKRLPNSGMVRQRLAEAAEMSINRLAHVEFWRKVLSVAEIDK